jgi:uncharacterized protein (DUF1330 family)
MRAYFFFDMLEVGDPEKLERYRGLVPATVERYGGRYLTVGGRCDVVEGQWRPVFPVLIEFPSLEQAHLWYNSEEYRQPKELRLAATRGNGVFIEGTEFGGRPGNQ